MTGARLLMSRHRTWAEVDGVDQFDGDGRLTGRKLRFVGGGRHLHDLATSNGCSQRVLLTEGLAAGARNISERTRCVRRLPKSPCQLVSPGRSSSDAGSRLPSCVGSQEEVIQISAG